MQNRNRRAMLALMMGLSANTMVIELPEEPRLDIRLDNRPARRARRTNRKMKERGF